MSGRGPWMFLAFLCENCPIPSTDNGRKGVHDVRYAVAISRFDLRNVGLKGLETAACKFS